MTHESATWLNRIGIILGFFSFWFAAPEFIGEERLKQWKLALANLTGTATWIIYYAASALLVGGWAGVLSLLHLTPYERLPPLFRKYGLAAAAVALLYFVLMRTIINRMALVIISKLANDSKQRQRSLFIGAFLFTISTVLQFLATFESAK